MVYGSLPAAVIYEKLEKYFKPDECTEVFPVIGLQYHNADRIKRVYTANFASEEVIDALVKMEAHDCLLFTHHPLPQRKRLEDPAPPIPQRYLDLMRDHHISLFSYHIPLDRNGEYSPGNNLARAMGFVPYGEFYLQNKVLMGVLCHTPCQTAPQVLDILEKAIGHTAKLYPYGSGELLEGSVAIMAGGAKSTDIYAYLKSVNVNTFITGVTNPSAPWVAAIHEQAKANGINLIGGTHYSTEKFAPIAMCGFFRNLGLESSFIPEAPKLTDL